MSSPRTAAHSPLQLADYLGKRYVRAKARLDEIRLVLRQIANLFEEIHVRRKGNVGYPYSWLLIDGKSTTWSPFEKLSISTQAMCAAGIKSLLEANHPQPFLSRESTKTLGNAYDSVV